MFWFNKNSLLFHFTIRLTMLFIDIIAVHLTKHEHTCSMWAKLTAIDVKLVFTQPIITPQQGIKSNL